jgi:hypothetical protein
VPRSAFLEGAREAGGTKTYSGAIVKQRTAVPQGAASLSLAVLESGGRKREVGVDNARMWGLVRREKQTARGIRPVRPNVRGFEEIERQKAGWRLPA